MTPQLAAAIASQWRTIYSRWLATYSDADLYQVDEFEARIEATYHVPIHVLNRAVYLNGDWFDYGRIGAGEEAGQRF